MICKPGIGLAPGASMCPIRVVRAFQYAAFSAAVVLTVACGSNSLHAGDGPEGGTSGSATGSGTATSGATAGSSGRTASAGAAATGSTTSGSGASPTGGSGSASGVTSGASSGAVDGGPQPRTCRTTSDCPSSATPFASIVTCEYALGQGCSAVGSCVTSVDTGPGPACGTLYYGCGCDGTDVYLGCDTSTVLTATKPIAHMGRCANDGGIGVE